MGEKIMDYLKYNYGALLNDLGENNIVILLWNK